MTFQADGLSEIDNHFHYQLPKGLVEQINKTGAPIPNNRFLFGPIEGFELRLLCRDDVDLEIPRRQRLKGQKSA